MVAVKKAGAVKKAAPKSPATTAATDAPAPPPAASEVGGLGQCSVCGARIVADGSCERGHGKADG